MSSRHVIIFTFDVRFISLLRQM